MRSILCVAGVVVLAGLCTALAGAREEGAAVSRTAAAVERLQAPDWKTRKSAKAGILEIYKELSASLKQDQQVSDLPEYQQLVDMLIAIVRKQRDKYQEHDEKLLAVELLGDLRAAKAVEVLLDNISFCPSPDQLEDLPLEISFPCAGALIKIGKRSVEGILQRLDRQYDYDNMGTLILYGVVVRKVEGGEAGKALLQAELEKARTRQANIAEMLFRFGGTVSDLPRMLREEDPQVRFAAARLYARFRSWPGPAAASTAAERAKFVSDTLARLEREGGGQSGGAGNEAQPQPKPAQPPPPAE